VIVTVISSLPYIGEDIYSFSFNAILNFCWKFYFLNQNYWVLARIYKINLIRQNQYSTFEQNYSFRVLSLFLREENSNGENKYNI